MAVDADAFRRALGQFAAGVTVVTTRDGAGRPLGLTVTAFSSLSLDPPLVLVCVDNRSEANQGLRASGLFGVSVLAEEQAEVSRRCAVPGTHKFEDGEWVPGPQGLPLVAGAIARLECALRSDLPGGDHTIYVGEVLTADVPGGRPLLYWSAGYRRLDDARGVEP
jgi:flavin reductase (DIM6/NTAB) family NADH-FMN oxidoreductase RutF